MARAYRLPWTVYIMVGLPGTARPPALSWFTPQADIHDTFLDVVDDIFNCCIFPAQRRLQAGNITASILPSNTVFDYQIAWFQTQYYLHNGGPSRNCPKLQIKPVHATPTANKVVAPASFAGLPPDIIYRICDRLPNKDVLKLQQLSSTISAKLPRSRLTAIHSQKTYYLCSYSIQKLERLIRNPSLAERVTHITFDVSVPYIRLRSRRSCLEEARNYPEDAQLRLQRWCNTHTRRWGSMKSSGPTRRPSTSTIASSRNAAANYEPAVSQAFSLFRSHFAANGTPEPAECDEEGLFRRITAAFTALPSLAVLEFAHTNPKTEDRAEMLSRWREYNNHLYTLLYIDPKIELPSGTWPWTSWLRPQTPSFLLSTAIPAILFCATQAERTISEVRVGNTSWGPQNFGLTISKFEPQHVRRKDGAREGWETAYYHWICRYVDDYKHTFGKVRRFELCLDPEEEERPENAGRLPELSLCLLTILKNVEDLKVWRLRGDAERQQVLPHPGSFVLPTDTLLPRLRRLEVGEYAGITLAGLTSFLLTNGESLRHLSCDLFTFGDTTHSKHDILSFLNMVKAVVSLRTLKIDFLVSRLKVTGPVAGTESIDHVYLGISVRGEWQSADCEFKVGVKRVSMTGEDNLCKTFWMRKQGWGDFINSVSSHSGSG
ncbi:hypothetical protein DRE_02771 [Drechslerella stenobrocha 248]|uniref:F-box domain-containing protein n=1 Tax=Drechslerella stenobrocha 248 TaxID=1043628 RepID=W7HWG5_9PEZI|nr:hypothetical protein DRE_02771 [Drechslerella stenobrocha 248]